MRLRTLLLILVVLLAIGWSGTQLSVISYPSSSTRIQATKTQISAFKSALEMFQVDNAFYPTTEQGLNVLIEKPLNAANWIRPYLDKIPLDPWGNEYHYRFPGIQNEYGFDIYSYGPDGRSETRGNDPDDINNWGTPEFSFWNGILTRIMSEIPLLLSGLVLLCLLVLKKWNGTKPVNPA